MLDVPEIVFKFLFPSERIAPVDLRPSGDTGQDIMPMLLFRAIPIEVFHHQGPRPDETHVALQHIEQSRKFIQAGKAEESTECGDPLPLGQQTVIGIAIIRHGPKFIDGKNPPVQARARLSEENGRTKVHTHQHGKTNQ